MQHCHPLRFGAECLALAHAIAHPPWLSVPRVPLLTAACRGWVLVLLRKPSVPASGPPLATRTGVDAGNPVRHASVPQLDSTGHSWT
jgi:hypothetical protein